MNNNNCKNINIINIDNNIHSTSNINNNNHSDSLINFDSFNPNIFNKSNVTLKHCKDYLNNVKARLINDPLSYQTFELILKEYYTDPSIHYQDVYNEIALLFNYNHQDLLNQLANHFLPFEQK